MHKNTRLLPYQRREAYRRWLQGEQVTELARQYHVSRTCLYETFKKARLGIFGNFTSKNQRYRAVSYGLKHLSFREQQVARMIAKRDRRKIRYERATPGELVHFDTKKLPVLPGEAASEPREHLHVAIDDYSRWLVADIFPDKTSYSSAIHLEEVRISMPFDIHATYSDNGSEYRGTKLHPFVLSCERYDYKQYFTRPRRPQTNGKAERVIRTLMTEWHRRYHFTSREQRRKYLCAYVAWYNQVRPHQSLDNQPPIKRLETYLAKVKAEAKSVNNA
jgi:transposase InsO family protein